MGQKNLTDKAKQVIFNFSKNNNIKDTASNFGIAVSTVSNIRAKYKSAKPSASPVPNKANVGKQKSVGKLAECNKEIKILREEIKILREEYNQALKQALWFESTYKSTQNRVNDMLDETKQLKKQNHDMLNVNCLYTKIITKLVQN